MNLELLTLVLDLLLTYKNCDNWDNWALVQAILKHNIFPSLSSKRQEIFNISAPFCTFVFSRTRSIPWMSVYSLGAYGGKYLATDEVETEGKCPPAAPRSESRVTRWPVDIYKPARKDLRIERLTCTCSLVWKTRLGTRQGYAPTDASHLLVVQEFFVCITEPCYLYLKCYNSGTLRQTSLVIYCMRI